MEAIPHIIPPLIYSFLLLLSRHTSFISLCVAHGGLIRHHKPPDPTKKCTKQTSPVRNVVWSVSSTNCNRVIWAGNKLQTNLLKISEQQGKFSRRFVYFDSKRETNLSESDKDKGIPVFSHDFSPINLLIVFLHDFNSATWIKFTTESNAPYVSLVETKLKKLSVHGGLGISLMYQRNFAPCDLFCPGGNADFNKINQQETNLTFARTGKLQNHFKCSWLRGKSSDKFTPR